MQQLLGVSLSIDDLATGLLRRTQLSDGRIEAHEFGMNQHSSASAGGVVVGLCGTPSVSTGVVTPLVRAVCALVDDTGFLRGHDRNGEKPPQAWGMSQVLLGLSYRVKLVSHNDRSKLGALGRNLLDMQDRESGGWPLRAGDPPGLSFTFYPVLAVSSAARQGLIPESVAGSALAAAASYLLAEVVKGHGSIEEQLLAVCALARIAPAGSTDEVTALTQQVEERALEGSALALRDRSIVVYPQPAWHAVLWRPLLYLALRRGMSALHPLKALLGAELLRTFDRESMAWRGPADGVRSGTGVSWASALALRATHQLAQDIAAGGLTVDLWLERCAELHERAYDFDVVVSFAGADRTIAAEICERLKRAGYVAFYDWDHRHALLGEDLAQYLQDAYFSRSRYAVVLISEHFLSSRWAGNWEWRAVLARMQQQQDTYLLPYTLDDTRVPGLNPTIGYVSAKEFSPTQFADLVVRKLRSTRRR